MPIIHKMCIRDSEKDCLTKCFLWNKKPVFFNCWHYLMISVIQVSVYMCIVRGSWGYGEYETELESWIWRSLYLMITISMYMGLYMYWYVCMSFCNTAAKIVLVFWQQHSSCVQKQVSCIWYSELFCCWLYTWEIIFILLSIFTTYNFNIFYLCKALREFSIICLLYTSRCV